MKPSRFIVVAFLALTIAWLGLATTASAQNRYGSGPAGTNTCVCNDTIEVEDANRCAYDFGPCVPNACLASGDAACPTGICVAAAQIGCATNQCLLQDANCNLECSVASTVGNVVLCSPVPALSVQGFVVFALLLAGMSVVLWRRRRSMSKRTLTGIMTVLLVAFALTAGTYAYGTFHADRACSGAASLAGLEAPRG